MDQEDFDIEMDRKSKGKFNRYVDMENHRHKPYGHRKKDILFFVYLISILLWGFLIAYLQPEIGIYGWVILAIPLLVFIISTLSLDSTSRAVEENFDGWHRVNVFIWRNWRQQFVVKERRVAKERIHMLSKFFR